MKCLKYIQFSRTFLRFVMGFVLVMFCNTRLWAQSPNDPLYPDQEYLDVINIEGAWSRTTGDANQPIAIIIPGGSHPHEDLSGKLLFQTQRIFNGQFTGGGTPYSGVTGAVTNNNTGIAGINWNADIYSYDVGNIRTEEVGPNNSPVQFLALNKSAIDNDINTAVNQGANSILMPFNWVPEATAAELQIPQFRIAPDFTLPNPKEFIFENAKKVAESIFSEFFSGSNQNYPNALNAAKSAYLNGKVIIGKTLDYDGSATGFPSNLAKDRISIAVGSSELTDSPFLYSSSATSHASQPNFTDVDVVAPGINVLTTSPYNSNEYEYETGTAAAASIVTGVVSLMQAEDPNLRPNDIKEILRRTAVDIGPQGYDAKSGYGRINASEALSYISERNFTRGDGHPKIIHKSDC